MTTLFPSQTFHGKPALSLNGLPLGPALPAPRPISGTVIYLEHFKAALRPDPRMTITEWSDAYRYLPQKSSSEPGKYRSARTPYLREIMDQLSPRSGVQEISVMKATQLGFTEVGNNWFCFIVDVCPGPMMMVFPTVELGKDHSKQKLMSTIEETPRLQGKIRDSRTRDSGNTLQTKEFPGGILFIAGSNSAAGFRSKSVRFLFKDDIDGWEADVGGEGDPSALADKRTDTFSARKKILNVSTPTRKGLSRIENHYLDSDQRRYVVPCPHCGEKQILEWGGKDATHGIKFERDLAGFVSAAWYVCRHCGAEISESHKTWMLENGEWRAQNPGNPKRGYQLSSLYSPLGWVSWRQIAQEFIEAKGSKEKLKVWVNTRLGETFEEQGEQPDWEKLKARCEPYEMYSVPSGGQLLTASVDTQDDRLEVLVKAWGYGEENWTIAHIVLYGDPNIPPESPGSPWAHVDRIRLRSYQREDGVPLKIASMGVDSGGHRTQAVYNYCRFRAPQVFALKGSSNKGKAIITKPSLVDVLWNGSKIALGCQLWEIGTDAAKDTIYSRIQQSVPGPGCYHWPIGLPDDYFLQLTAEKLVTGRNKNGFPVLEWVKVRERNEALDLEVYAYAAALRAGINWTLGPATPEAPATQNQDRRAGALRDYVEPTPIRDRRMQYVRPSWLER